MYEHPAVAPRMRYARLVGPVPALTGARSFTIVGQDGGQSIELPEGKSLFVFCDTLLRPTATEGGDSANAYFLPNCAALSDGPNYLQALRSLRYFGESEGLPRTLLRANVSEHCTQIRFWPEHGVHIAGRVYLYYLGIRHFDVRQTWAFELEGSGLAVVDLLTGHAERMRWGGDWQLQAAGPERLHFGVQVLRHEGWLLLYATAKSARGRRARLYRVRPDNIEDRDAYELLVDPRPAWSPMRKPPGGQPAVAFDLGPCGTELSVSYNSWLDAYLMTFVSELDGQLHMRCGSTPWGSFSAPLRVGTLPRAANSELTYLAFEHPQFATNGGQELMISYCQPHFVRNSIMKVSLAPADMRSTWPDPVTR